MMNTALAVQRTPELIAAEINNIKDQTMFMALNNSIEIGRRLVEAKSLVQHGEWGQWLKESVDFSPSTANNLMRLFKEYGANQLALFGETGAKSQALGKLKYTQALALLGIPDEEREEFIEQHDIENMSTRELQKAIKELAQAKKELEEKTAEGQKWLEEKENSEKEIEKLTKAIEDTKEKLAEAQALNNTDAAEQLQESLEKTDAELCDAQKRIEELENQLKEKPIDVPAVVKEIPEEIEEELAELRKQQKSAVAVKYSMQFNNLVQGFKDLLVSLAEIEQEDAEEGERYKHATLELISKMSARL